MAAYYEMSHRSGGIRTSPAASTEVTVFAMAANTLVTNPASQVTAAPERQLKALAVQSQLHDRVPSNVDRIREAIAEEELR